MTSTRNGASQIKLVTAGEFFLDLIFYDLDELPRLGEELKTENFTITPGGGAAITACAAARLGHFASLVTAWGDSALDAQVRSQLEEIGVRFDGARICPGTTSGITVAVSTRADRYFLTFPGANRFLESYLLSDQNREALQTASHVHFALAPADWARYGGLIEELHQTGVSASWDLGWDPVAAGSEGFREVYRQLDVIFLNELEACRYADATSVDAALKSLSTPDNTVVVKLGKNGAAATRKGSPPVRAAGISVDAVDSTGAGDAFNGGFLCSWLAGESLLECLQSGNICGAFSTRQPGGVAGLPSQEEFDQRRRTARAKISGLTPKI